MLPSALLDLVSLRLSTRPSPTVANLQLRGRIRRVQQLAPQQNFYSSDEALLIRTPGHSIISPNDRTPPKVQRTPGRNQAVAKLEARVAAWKDTVDKSIQTAETKRSEAQHDGSYFPEATLQEIYKDLLASPVPGPSEEKDFLETRAASVEDILGVIRKRLPEFEAAVEGQADKPEGLATRLWSRVPHTSPHAWQNTPKSNLNTRILEDIATWESGSPLRELISRLRVVLEVFRSIWSPVKVEYTSHEMRPAPFQLLSTVEWRALSEACLNEEDPCAAEVVLELMRNVGLPPSEEQCDMILGYFANRGLVEHADRYFASFGLDVPRELQRDYLIKARIKAKQIDEACTLLHAYETRNIPAPMKSYTRIIRELLVQRGPGSTQRSAQAWDLFAHMRYVAHPVPDAFLYSTMIRASAEPERALDLFTEMTVEQRIPPDTYAYTAVIRACARSKRFALHAFRIAREMLNSHRDAHGQIPAHLRPDMHTFLGLLDAAKRIGDLARARWILAEMSQGARDVEGGEEKLVYVNEKALTHMFHAYAAYQPPFRRKAVPLVREGASTQQEKHGEGEEKTSSDEDHTDVQHIVLPQLRSIPQTRGEVIHEATQLWERMLADREEMHRHPDSDPPPLFGRVRPDSSLLNAYLGVQFVHSVPSEAYVVYDTIFEQLGMKRDAFTYALALEAYSKGSPRLSQHERSVATSRARDIWKEWCMLENGNSAQELYDKHGTSQVEARLVERAWGAMIRVLTLADNVEEAEQLLRSFARRYPPRDVRRPAPLDPRRSNGTRLYAERPLIRLMEPSAVAEDRIAPFFTFTDMAMLHNRAVTKGMLGLVDYLKWLLSSYEGALRRRREAQVRGR